MNAVRTLDTPDGSTRWSTTVGDVCDRFGGDVQTGPFGSQLHASDYADAGTPVVMPQDLYDGRIITDRIARVAERHVARLRQHQLKSGDIVYSRRGDVGRFAIVSDAESGWLCGTGCIRIRLNCSDLDIRYARRYLQQPKIEKWLLHHAKGVTMANLNTAIIRALPFVYPPFPEQRRIADILDKADALRAKRHAALAKLDELVQSIFLDMFGDPATNPKDWPMKAMGSLATKFSDGPFGSNLKSEHYTDSGVRVVRLQNIGVGEFIDDDAAYISGDHFAMLKKHECRPGDVLVGTLGDPNLRACIQPKWLTVALNKADCVQIRPDTHLANAAFICGLLNQPSTERMAQNLMLGQTRVRISMGRLRGLQVPVPPIKLQREFDARVAVVERLRAGQLSAQTHLAALFAALQHRAFAGELALT